MDDELSKQRQLLAMLKGDDDSEVDKQQLRYGLYVRKSTAGDEKQESSIEDQTKDCLDRIVGPQDLMLLRFTAKRFRRKQPTCETSSNALSKIFIVVE